jgi:rieske iron-sulfur protein
MIDVPRIGFMKKLIISRRRMLDIGLSAASTVVVPVTSQAADARTVGPQRGDALVAISDARDTPLQPRDLRHGAPPVLTWPMDLKTGLVRDGARFNQVLLLRLAGDRDEAHGGRLVAFSAVCSHAGCIVSAWRAADRLLLCPCHGSEYDPSRAAAVVAGPAPLPLPTLPLGVSDGLIVVVGSFSAPPGGHTGRTD